MPTRPETLIIVATISIEEQIELAENELSTRRRIYPGLVQKGHMTSGAARYQTAVMGAIVDTLKLARS
jgi:hypothetical protein